MNDLSKREVREAVREALSNANIPSENEIRKIVQEEMQRQKELEEQKEKIGVLEHIRIFTKSRDKWKTVGMYTISFIIMGFICFCLTFFSEILGNFSQMFSLIFCKKVIYIFFTLASLLLSSISMVFLLHMYDKMRAENHKYARVIFITMIIVWLQAVDPDLLSLLQGVL